MTPESKTTKEQYEAGVLELALASGRYSPCFRCGMPYVHGLICTFCKEPSPHVALEERL